MPLDSAAKVIRNLRAQQRIPEVNRVVQMVRIFSLWVWILVALLDTQVWAGGDQFNIAGLGMGKTYVAMARGIDAVGLNPANLAMRDRGRKLTLVILPSFGASISTTFMNFGTYQRYFTGVDPIDGSEREGYFLRNEDKEDILSQFPQGIGQLNFGADIRWFGLTFTHDELGGIGFTVTELFAANADIPEDYARFVLYGFPPEGITYDLGSTDFRGWWLREYSLTYARKINALRYIGHLFFGASVKLVHGYAYFETERYNGRITNGNPQSGYVLRGDFDFSTRRSGTDFLADKLSESRARRENASFQLMPAPAGSGLGFDVGMTADPLPWMTVGMSVTDIGTVTWKRNLRETSSTLNINIDDPLEPEQEDSLRDAFEGETRKLRGQISSSLPTAFRLGLAVQVHKLVGKYFLGELIAVADYNQGFNDSPGNSKRARISLGIEYRPISFLPLRSGISLGGLEGSFWSAGFGFDFSVLSLDFASESARFLVGSDGTNEVSVAFGMKLRF